MRTSYPRSAVSGSERALLFAKVALAAPSPLGEARGEGDLADAPKTRPTILEGGRSGILCRLNFNSALTLWMGVLLFVFGIGFPLQAVVLYQTGFEASEGYSTNLDLVGQQGWLGAGSGGNGILTGFTPGNGQQAYIGFTPPNTTNATLFVYHPINKAVPRVQFSVSFSILDSSNTNYDDFYWAVFNQQGDQLVTLDFDNFWLKAYYILQGATNRTWSGLTFTNGVAYQLIMTLDFTSNLWSAALGPTVLATNQPITTSGSPLNLGDIDAAWVVYDPAAPGDNFMVFDNYQISAVLPPPQLSLLGLVNGAPTLRLTGLSQVQFALDVSTNLTNWLPLKTNLATGGSFDYVDSSAANAARKFYRARWVP